MNTFWEDRKEMFTPQPEDARTVWDMDYGRIVHSAPFRRLQGKTQILNIGDSDFYRTRLTHTLEVSQIATGIVRQLRKDLPEGHPARAILPDDSLIQAISLTHDLGHPPFGHGGEVALNYCMRHEGGFEGNAQSLRILTRLMQFSKNAGANLTRRTLLGGLKYPASYAATCNDSIVPRLNDNGVTRTIDREACRPPKCHFDCEQDYVDWMLEGIDASEKAKFCAVTASEGKHGKTRHKSFDCTIMDVADDIAYGIHDLEDAISLKLITEDQFREDVPDARCKAFLDDYRDRRSKGSNDVYGEFVGKLFADSGRRKHQISRLVHYFVTNIEVYEEKGFTTPLLKHRVRIKSPQRDFLDALKDHVFRRVIKSPAVQHLEFKGQGMVVAVFEVLASEPENFLPADSFERYRETGGDARVICDYIAGMTDHFLLKTYDRLFSPRMGSVFDKL